MKFPLLVLMKGDINSRVVYAINNGNNKFAIPMFTNGELCQRYLSRLNEGEMHAIALRDEYNAKTFVEATMLIAQVRWVLLDPTKCGDAENSGGKLLQIPEFLSKINSLRINNRNVFKKRRHNKNKK